MKHFGSQHRLLTLIALVLTALFWPPSPDARAQTSRQKAESPAKTRKKPSRTVTTKKAGATARTKAVPKKAAAKPAARTGAGAKQAAARSKTPQATQVRTQASSSSGAPAAHPVTKARPSVASKRPAPARITTPQSKPLPKPKPAARPAARPTPRPTPGPAARPAPAAQAPAAAPVQLPAPPTAQAYVAVKPGIETSYGQTMVPVSFIADGIGASIGPIESNSENGSVWRISWFDRVADLYPYQKEAVFDGKQVTLPAAPMNINGEFYVPWAPIAEFLGIKWSIAKNPDNAEVAAESNVMLVQFPASYIDDIRHSTSGDRTRVVVQLSNATRIVAARRGADVQFFFAAARKPGVPSVHSINDYLVPRAVTRSGNWSANVSVRLNYSAPVRWFTLGSPPRLVIDLQKIFEEKTDDNMESGLSLTKIRRGLNRGPVQMFLARVDPREGWRLRVVPAGYSTLQRNRPSVIAQRNKALVGVNGGFFAYDGAAVGALMVNNEWIRLPWGGRTAIGFRPDGSAKIDNLVVAASAVFGSGLRINIKDLNGWPDRNRVTALTSRFQSIYKLRPGEIGLVVKDGKVTAKPGSGTVLVPGDGFLLVANGGAVPWLNRVARGESARLNFYAPGWDGITSALGAGPRLVRNGKIDVTDRKENFREDVRIGTGPRTAVGIDREGRLLILVVDGRKPYYSTGLTLNELAATLIKLGAVDAVNLDGGGSTAMAVRGKLINRPSDGFERSVANALLVMR